MVKPEQRLTVVQRDPMDDIVLECTVAGEAAYIDDGGDVLCRLEVRQGDKTKIDLNKTACFNIVLGNATTDAASLQTAAEELIPLIKQFCGGQERMLRYGFR